ncbi:MAG TPA: penicillin-binding protein, partial [Clostridiaceae bacterium]|nr:penicillin-binding protein [Clostridiaceae bacterium]
VTTASFIENENQSLDRTFNCNGKLKIGNYTLIDQNNKSHGKINLKNAFKYSCNYTFGSIGMELGYDRLKDSAEKFMFNKDIPLNQDYDTINIKSGGISIGDKNDKAELAQNAIGQNKVAANPMTMALVTSAIANNGVMMKPYIVKEVKNPYGFKISETVPQELTESISRGTSDIIKDYMVETVKSGTGTNARIQGTTVAGKTGSAEDSSNNQSHSWFVAFAPAEDPQIAVAVIVENAGYGGGRAAEVARETIKAYLNK